MWLFTKTGFVSIVEKAGDREAQTVTVRSRDLESLEVMREDIYKLYEYDLGEADIAKNAGSDYAYRMVITKEELRRYMVAIVDGIDYDNFKSEIVPNRKNSGGEEAGKKWHDTLMKIWSATFGISDDK